MVGPFQEADGSYSMRRILALFFALTTVALSIIAFPYSVNGWFVFIPAGLSLLATIFFLFFTTWSDVISIIGAVKKSE